MQIIIAFAEPPAEWGFKPAKSGKSWWLKLDEARVEKCRAALKARGIDSLAKPATPWRGNGGSYQRRW